MSQIKKISVKTKVKARKSRSKRSEIPHATCKRLIKDSSILDDTRITSDALIHSNEHLKNFVRELGKQCAELLKMFKGKRVTISSEILLGVLRTMEHSHGIKPTDIAVPPSGKYESDLPKAGIARLFNEGSGGCRAVKEVRIMTVQAAEAYLRYIGHRSSEFVRNRKGKTIQMKDIVLAIKTS